MDKLLCVNVRPLPDNECAPPLELEKEYDLKQVYICKCGEKHFDVGLKSSVAFVTCYVCREELPNGKEIHWAHSSRFLNIKQ